VYAHARLYPLARTALKALYGRGDAKAFQQELPGAVALAIDSGEPGEMFRGVVRRAMKTIEDDAPDPRWAAEASPDCLPGDTPDPLAEFEARETARAMWRVARSALTDPEFAVCELVAQDKSDSQIAEELRIPLGTVKTYRHRMKAKLAPRFQHLVEKS
jgi:DNA-binding CsgD family transcriptional regulator